MDTTHSPETNHIPQPQEIEVPFGSVNVALRVALERGSITTEQLTENEEVDLSADQANALIEELQSQKYISRDQERDGSYRKLETATRITKEQKVVKQIPKTIALIGRQTSQFALHNDISHTARQLRQRLKGRPDKVAERQKEAELAQRNAEQAKRAAAARETRQKEAEWQRNRKWKLVYPETPSAARSTEAEISPRAFGEISLLTGNSLFGEAKRTPQGKNITEAEKAAIFNDFLRGADGKTVDATQTIIERGQVNIGTLQRQLRLDVFKTRQFLEDLIDAGVISPPEGNEGWKVHITPEDFDKMISQPQAKRPIADPQDSSSGEEANNNPAAVEQAEKARETSSEAPKTTPQGEAEPAVSDMTLLELHVEVNRRIAEAQKEGSTETFTDLDHRIKLEVLNEFLSGMPEEEHAQFTEAFLAEFIDKHNDER